MITALKNYRRIFSQNGGGGTGAGLNYKGTWDANANSPFLASGVGTAGDYYVVSTAGNTNLDGVTDWNIDDWAIFNGTIWQKIDNSETGDKNYVHTQSVANTTWNVAHNLAKRCSVQVVNDSFEEIEASITWTDDNNVVVTFNTATTGYVYCN
jgi:hypothetical protein